MRYVVLRLGNVETDRALAGEVACAIYLLIEIVPFSHRYHGPISQCTICNVVIGKQNDIALIKTTYIREVLTALENDISRLS